MSIWSRLFGGARAGGPETRALTLRIRELLNSGKSADEVRDILIREGVRPRRAASMVALVLKAQAASRRLFDTEP
jgi:hypothetical protein